MPMKIALVKQRLLQCECLKVSISPLCLVVAVAVDLYCPEWGIGKVCIYHSLACVFNVSRWVEKEGPSLAHTHTSLSLEI